MQVRGAVALASLLSRVLYSEGKPEASVEDSLTKPITGRWSKGAEPKS